MHHFPQQKTQSKEEWGPLASTFLHASLTSQMLVPSSQINSFNQNDEDEDNDEYQPTKKRTPIGRMDASTDDDER